MTTKFRKNRYISDSESESDEDLERTSEEDEDSASETGVVESRSPVSDVENASEEDEDSTSETGDVDSATNSEDAGGGSSGTKSEKHLNSSLTSEDSPIKSDEDSVSRYKGKEDLPSGCRNSVANERNWREANHKHATRTVDDDDDGFDSFIKRKSQDWVTSTRLDVNHDDDDDDSDGDIVKSMDHLQIKSSFDAAKVVKTYGREKSSLPRNEESSGVSVKSSASEQEAKKPSSAVPAANGSKTKTFIPESSASGLSESIIDDSFSHHVTNKSKNAIQEAAVRVSTKGEGDVVIEESGDSDGSDVQFIESVTVSPSSREICVSSNVSTSGSCKSDVEITNSDSALYKIEDSEEEKSSVKDASKGESAGQTPPGNKSNDESGNDGSGKKDELLGMTPERLIEAKAAAYRNIMRAVRGCDFTKLKDGGKLLQEKMIRCKEELDELREKYKNAGRKIGGGGDDDSAKTAKSKIASNPIFSTKDQVTSNLGKKGIETHRVQAALTIDALVTIHESLRTCPDENTSERDPEGLVVELLPHQRHALAWLLWRERQTPTGGILADDMGLGKTLSIISLILRAEEIKRETETECEEQGSLEVIDGNRTYKGNTLVVCPASLLGQWEGQIKQHCAAKVLSSKIHHGKTRSFQAKQLARYDVVITTYGLLAEENKTRDDEKRGILFRVRWERVVLDEAHIIRNHKTQKAVAACELIAKYRWCLTGTPVHNKELDMYSLLKFLRCSPFDDRAVWKRWVDNKSINGVQRLRTVIKSILLRRTKEDLKIHGQLKELPLKKSVPVYVDLDEEELKVYHKVLQFSKSLLAEYLHQKDLNQGGGSERIESVRRKLKASGEDIKTTEIFVLLLRLRQVCCLPGLIHAFLEKETCIETGLEPENPTIEDLYTQMSRLSVAGAKDADDDVVENRKVDNVLLKSNPVFKMNRRSTKIQTLLSILEDIMSTDDKVVIVSQWTNMLRNLEQHIRSLNVGIVTLDGSVPVKFRQGIIDDFNREKSNVRIMLLSLNAGGVGLNLIGGNRLVIFEPHWNPQLESQACDRVYRVGQRKEVIVYKIICKNTIEERIELLQKKKLELAKSLLQGVDPSKKSQVAQLSLGDLMTLFEV